MSESEQRSIRLSTGDCKQLEKLVRAGQYKNFNDAVNYAVRCLITDHREQDGSGKVVEGPNEGEEIKEANR